MLSWTSQRSSSWGHLRNVWVGSRSSLSSWIELITLIKLLMRLNTLRLHLMIVKLLLLWILRLHIKLVVFAYRCLRRLLELLSMRMHHSSKTRYIRRILRTIVYLVWWRLNVLVDLIKLMWISNPLNIILWRMWTSSMHLLLRVASNWQSKVVVGGHIYATLHSLWWWRHHTHPSCELLLIKVSCIYVAA